MILVYMVKERAAVRENYDIVTELSHFSDDVTFISGEGYYIS
jgi:hypothetical protein